MRIAVCMKQVPAYSEGNMDEKTGLIIRSGQPAIVNVYDLDALETALRIKEKTGARVDVYTMGPQNAEGVLREAYAYGADYGYFISDKAFGGADVLATSYTLMQAIKSQGEYDLVLCGKQTTDGDTAQVGGALAKWLDIPHFAGVTKLLKADNRKLSIEQELEDSCLILEVDYPCLLAVEHRIFPVRMPSLKLKMAGRKKQITRIDMTVLEDRDKRHYGLNGSATRVKSIFPPRRTRQQEAALMGAQQAAVYILQTVQKIRKGDDTDG